MGRSGTLGTGLFLRLSAVSILPLLFYFAPPFHQHAAKLVATCDVFLGGLGVDL